MERKIEEICDMLEQEAIRESERKIKEVEKYKAGYMQGCEDMLRNFQEYLMSQERELKR